MLAPLRHAGQLVSHLPPGLHLRYSTGPPAAITISTISNVNSTLMAMSAGQQVGSGVHGYFAACPCCTMLHAALGWCLKEEHMVPSMHAGPRSPARPHRAAHPPRFCREWFQELSSGMVGRYSASAAVGMQVRKHLWKGGKPGAQRGSKREPKPPPRARSSTAA